MRKITVHDGTDATNCAAKWWKSKIPKSVDAQLKNIFFQELRKSIENTLSRFGSATLSSAQGADGILQAALQRANIGIDRVPFNTVMIISKDTDDPKKLRIEINMNGKKFFI